LSNWEKYVELAQERGLTDEQLKQIVGERDAPIRRICQGKLALSEKEQQRYAKMRDSLENDFTLLDKTRATIKREVVELGLALPPMLQDLETKEQVLEALTWLQRLRFAHFGKPCGYDFNLTILSGPLDGKETGYLCPNCGNKGTYRSPKLI
jgi:hypothetical protein